LENPSVPAASAGRGAFLIAGYCFSYQQSPIEFHEGVECVAGAVDVLTEVVFTPQSSNFSNVGVGALGVAMNSNSLSEP
jgi:hypothetical protein